MKTVGFVSNYFTLCAFGLTLYFIKVDCSQGFFIAEAKCPPCTVKHLESVKQVCRTEGQTLADVDNDKQTNATIVCTAFDELLKCVAQRVPACLATIGDEYQQYTMTPWDCHLGEKQVLIYQSYLQTACQRMADENSKTAEVNTGSPEVNFSSQDRIEKSQTKTYRIDDSTSNNQSSNTANGIFQTSLLHRFPLQHISIWCGLIFYYNHHL